MNTLVHDFAAVGEDHAAAAAPMQQGPAGMSRAWAALHEAAAVVRTLAGEEPEQAPAEVRNFPALIGDAGGARRRLAEKGLADLGALMEPGIAALLAVNARGADATPAARALWREFRAARAGLIALLPPAGTLGPRRKA